MRPGTPRMCEPKRCWAPPGMRPHAPQHAIRQAVYAFAALAPQLGKMVALLLPYADTAMMNLFLQHVSEAFADAFIIMQVDQAERRRRESEHRTRGSVQLGSFAVRLSHVSADADAALPRDHAT